MHRLILGFWYKPGHWPWWEIPTGSWTNSEARPLLPVPVRYHSWAATGVHKDIFLPTIWGQEPKLLSVWARWSPWDDTPVISPQLLPSFLQPRAHPHAVHSRQAPAVQHRYIRKSRAISISLCYCCSGEMLYFSVSKTGIFHGTVEAISKSVVKPAEECNEPVLVG